MSEGTQALAGIRIADFSRVLVGPICTRILGTLGAQGQSGPESPYVAYGMSLHAYSGLVSLTGYPDGEGLGIGGTWADPVSGLFAATLVLAALDARRRGRLPGMHCMDQSMVDCLI